MKRPCSAVPRVTERILRLLYAHDYYLERSGDLEEAYSDLVKESGLLRAKVWLWFQILKLFYGIIRINVVCRFIMLKNYIKIAFRNIKRHRWYTFINIAGLALGIACFILIMLYVQFELSYDKFHKNAGRIYRVSTYVSNDATSSAPLAPVLKETYPEILSIVRISRLGFSSDDKILFLHGDKKILENEVFLADPELFNVLSFEFLKGNPETALINPNSIIMTEEMAEKYFNNEDPMGKVLSYENSHDFIVTGVLKNFPANSHLSFKFIIPFENNKIILNYNLTNWDQNFCYTYLRLREDANPEELEKKSNALLIEHWFENVRNEHNKNAKLYFFPITSLYLHPPRGGGPFTFLNILMLIAFFILIIACINYINLTTAKSAQRAKEVGIRKVVGAQRNQLVIQLFAESVFISLIAFFLSLIIVMLVLPVFSQFVDRDLDFNLLGNYKFISLLLLVVAFVSLSSSSYPAFYISSFRPITILRGILKTGTKGSMLKNILVVFQFVISIVLIFCSLVIRDQVHFIRNKDIGFDKNQIVNISVRDKNVRQHFKALITELRKNPGVLSASASSHLPSSIDYSSDLKWPEKTDDRRQHCYFGMVDFDFCDVFDIEIVKGRNFSRDNSNDRAGAFLINESAAKAMNVQEPLGTEITCWGTTGKIVGVMKDFHFQSFYKEIGPLALFLYPMASAWKDNYISVKMRANTIPETLEYLKSKMEKFSPAYPFEYNFFDDVFDKNYRNVERTGMLFSIFASISIFIGCLGFLGLATFISAQRTKEIGIRKVLGATANHIIYMLSKKFVKWVLIAAAIAFPVGWFAMNNWLQNFAYRIDIKLWIFAAAAALALFIALLTISFQIIKAALSNPVDSLRYE